MYIDLVLNILAKSCRIVCSRLSVELTETAGKNRTHVVAGGPAVLSVYG